LVVNDEEEDKGDNNKSQIRLPPKSSTIINRGLSVIQKPETSQQKPVKITQLSVIATNLPPNQAGKIGGKGKGVSEMSEEKKTSLICLTKVTKNNEDESKVKAAKEVIKEGSDEDDDEGVIDDSSEDGKIPTDDEDGGEKRIDFHDQLQSMIRMAQSKVL